MQHELQHQTVHTVYSYYVVWACNTHVTVEPAVRIKIKFFLRVALDRVIKIKKGFIPLGANFMAICVLDYEISCDADSTREKFRGSQLDTGTGRFTLN